MDYNLILAIKHSKKRFIGWRSRWGVFAARKIRRNLNIRSYRYNLGCQIPNPPNKEIKSFPVLDFGNLQLSVERYQPHLIKTFIFLEKEKNPSR